MRALGRYALTGLLMVAAAAVAILPFLDDDGKRGVLLAAGIAFPVQVTAFGLLLRAQGEPSRFLFWWGVGVAVRVAVVVAVGFTLARMESVGSEALLLSLAGFFFGMLMVEPAFLKGASKGAQGVQ